MKKFFKDQISKVGIDRTSVKTLAEAPRKVSGHRVCFCRSQSPQRPRVIDLSSCEGNSDQLTPSPISSWCSRPL